MLNSRLNDNDFFGLLNDSTNPLSEVPFKTLHWIQEANGTKLVFLELFNCLKKIETRDCCIKDINLRLVVIIEEIAYVKKVAEDILYIVNIKSLELEHKKHHYIALIKNKNVQLEDHFLEAILSLLNEEKKVAKIQTEEYPAFLRGTPWQLEKVLIVNLNETSTPIIV